MGRENDGQGRSWTVPAYTLNSELVNGDGADEDELPSHNGNPHPFHDPLVLGEEQFVQDLVNQYIDNMPQNNQQEQFLDQASNAVSGVRIWRKTTTLIVSNSPEDRVKRKKWLSQH
jgi:hypothetical protein